MTDNPDEVFRLLRLLDELNVATALHCSVATVKRERQRGRLGFTRIGGRIRYTEDQIRQYLLNQSEEPSCQKTGSDKSGNIGFPSRDEALSGVEPGSTKEPDRLGAHRLAQRILMKPSSRSPNG